MVQFKVTVDNGEVYKGEYLGSEITISEYNEGKVINVNEKDGGYTLHNVSNVENIELVTED